MPRYKKASTKRKYDEVDNDDVHQPDAAPSSSAGAAEVEDDNGLPEIPDGEYPTTKQLEKILSYIFGLPASSRGRKTDTRRKSTLAKLDQLLDWINPSDGDGDEVTGEKTKDLKTSLFSLGFPLRALFYIEENMKDIDLVSLVANIMSWLTSAKSMVVERTCELLIENDCFRIFLLAIEETPQKKTKDHWLIVEKLTTCIRNIVRHTATKLNQNQITFIVESVFPYFQDASMGSTTNAVGAIGDVAFTLGIILQTHNVVVGLYKQRSVIRTFLQFCKKHESDWLVNKQSVGDVLFLCSLGVKNEVIDEDEAIDWIPLVGKGLLEGFNTENFRIERCACAFIDIIIDKIDHRKLEATELVPSLHKILKSDDVTEAIKTKYRGFIRQIMS